MTVSCFQDGVVPFLNSRTKNLYNQRKYNKYSDLSSIYLFDINKVKVLGIAIKMLDLEIVPERSLGCEQWEFILGEFFFVIYTI